MCVGGALHAGLGTVCGADNTDAGVLQGVPSLGHYGGSSRDQ